MVGDGPEKERAENLCNELGIADRVIFLGNSNEIDRILSFKQFWRIARSKFECCFWLFE